MNFAEEKKCTFLETNVGGKPWLYFHEHSFTETENLVEMRFSAFFAYAQNVNCNASKKGFHGIRAIFE